MTGRFILKGTIADVANAVRNMAAEEEQDDEKEQVEVELDDTFKFIFKTVFGV